MTEVTISRIEADTDPGSDIAVQDACIVAERAQVEILVDRVHMLMHHHATTYVEIGKCLAEIRERTQNKGEEGWLAILERLGIAKSTAYRHIGVYKKVIQMPALKDMAQKSVTKAITLIESTTDEELAQIASGQGELTLDQVDSMNVRQLKLALRKRTLEVGKIVAEETKLLKSEAEHFRKRAEIAEAQIQSDWETAESLARSIRGTADDLAKHGDQLWRVITALDGNAKRRVIIAMQNALGSSTTLLQDLWVQLQERMNNDWNG